MIGTSFENTGGVAGVVNVYRRAGLFERWPVVYLATHGAGGNLRKLLLAMTAWSRFMRLLLRGRIALLHAHTASNASFWRKSMFVMPSLWLGIPVVLHIHGGGFIEFYNNRCGQLRKRVVRFVLEHSERVITLSPSWFARLQGIAPNARVVCIPNPALIPRRQPRRNIGLIALFLGKLCRDKGVFDLLEAIAYLKNRLPGLRLSLAGDGDPLAVRTRAEILGVAGQVELLGWVSGEAKERLLREASVCVLPSYVEGTPMSLLEAMGAGLPSVATKVGGIPDMLTDGVEGRLVEPGDIVALAEALEQLLTDRKAYARMSEAALARFSSEFSADVVMPRLERLYTKFGVTPRCDIAVAEVSG